MNNFDKAVLAYFKTEDPNELDSLLTSPNLIIDSGIIPENHILKEQAIVILDSLNSYNKGIDNYESEDDLYKINELSPLFSWRCATLAIKEFYNENPIMVNNYLDEIKSKSPLQKLSSFITKNGKNALFSHNKDLESSVDALKDVINNSLIDLYPDCVKMIFTDLKNISDYDKSDIILTIIEESIDFIPLETIHKSVFSLIPISESTRLMALATIFKHPVKGLEYLFSYFTLAEFESNDDINLIALITVIKDVVQTLINDKFKFQTTLEKNSFRRDSDLFINRVSELYPIDYKWTKEPLVNLKRALNIKFTEQPVEVIKSSNYQGELF